MSKPNVTMEQLANMSAQEKEAILAQFIQENQPKPKVHVRHNVPKGDKGKPSMQLVIASPGGFQHKVKLGDAPAERPLTDAERQYLRDTAEAIAKLANS